MKFDDHPALSHPIFKAVEKSSVKLGYPAFVVGGFVRDIILQRECKDIDFVCVGSGIELANETAAILNKSINVYTYKNFGTAMFNFNDFQFEFVGARKESYRKDSRKPLVEDGSLEDDQNRRDFTINALAISLNAENYGELIDPFNGLADIENRILKTPLDPNITFSDDPLRMMRGIRFASQLNFTLHPATEEAISINAHRISIISQERITDELNKIILSPLPSIGFKLLFNTGLLKLIFPELTALHGIEERNGISHKDNFFHTLEVLDNLSKVTNDLWLRWAAILHDIAKPPTKRFDKKAGWTFHGHDAVGAKMVPRIFKRLKLPTNEKMKYVQKLVLYHLRPISLSKENITDSAIRRILFDAGNDIDDLLLLCNADITSKNASKVKRYKENFKRVKEKLIEVEEKDQIRNFQPPITGEMIMNTFDIKPCKTIGDLKTAIKDAILEGEIRNDYDEAFTFMLKEAAKLGLKPKGEE